MGRTYTEDMSAAKSSKSNNIPADLQPYYDQPRSTTWARWVTRILALVIVICLAVMFVRWAWHQTHTADNGKSDTSTSQKADSGSKSPASSSNGQINLGGSSEGDTEPNQSTTNTNTQPTNGQSSNSSNLTNTGPGQTLTVFIAATICFALLYELRLRKRLQD